MKKLGTSLCCLLLACSTLAGCNVDLGFDDSSLDDTKTQIFVELKSGGTGVQWLVDAGARFSALHEDTVYEDGKMGVVIVPQPTDNPSVKNAETSGAAIFDIMGMVNVENDARAGKILAIDDVLTDKSDLRQGVAISPAEKISDDQRARYMYDGHYYGGPSCEYYPTISYDRNLFDKYHFYFVSPDEAADPANEGLIVEHYSQIMQDTYYFLPNNNNNNDAMKSCGPDGKYNTEDDGLPSSLYEYIALCEYIKSKGIHPFNFTGGYKYYSNFLLSALYTSLQGYDGAMSNYNYTGEIEIVTGFEDDYIFPGVTTVKKPITRKVNVTEETGYYTTWKVEKYYAEAFMDLCIKQGWFGPSESNNDDQKAAIYKFVFSDNGSSAKIAMHLDGSYWYNEATEGENFFELLEPDVIAGMTKPRDVRVMPLPVNIKESVEEGEGRAQALLEMNYGMLVINKNVEKNPGLMKAAKDFLKFLYTDAELSAYTASTSILRSMNYELSSDDAAAISSYGKHLMSLIDGKNGKVVYFAGNNATFKANTSSFMQSWENAVFKVSGVAPSTYEAIKLNKKSVEDVFCTQAISYDSWANMYKGSSAAASIDGLTKLTH